LSQLIIEIWCMYSYYPSDVPDILPVYGHKEPAPTHIQHEVSCHTGTGSPFCTTSHFPLRASCWTEKWDIL